jgi:hypothetical protein
MEVSKAWFCSSNFSSLRERIPSKFIKRPKKIRQLWAVSTIHYRFCRAIVEHTTTLWPQQCVSGLLFMKVWTIVHEYPDYCSWKSGLLFMKVWTIVHERLNYCSWTSGLLFMNFWTIVHERLNYCSWKSGLLFMNVWTIVHESLDYCSWTSGLLFMNVWIIVH